MASDTSNVDVTGINCCYLPDAAIKQKDAGLKTRSSRLSGDVDGRTGIFFIAVQKSDRSTNAAVNAIKVEWRRL
jgi:hypothetical protein